MRVKPEFGGRLVVERERDFIDWRAIVKDAGVRNWIEIHGRCVSIDRMGTDRPIAVCRVRRTRLGIHVWTRGSLRFTGSVGGSQTPPDSDGCSSTDVRE